MSGPVFAADGPPLAAHLAAQTALFDEQYETDLRDFPERAQNELGPRFDIRAFA